MTTTLTTLHRPSEFVPGDRLVALDGRPLDAEHDVVAVGPGAVRLRHPDPNPHGVEWWVYAETLELGAQVERHVVERSPLRDWRKLPPVSYGYSRIPDRRVPPSCGHPEHRTPTWIRMVRCDTCGGEIASLGIGYHRQNTGH